ncbi:phosphomevalonate kinase [Pelomyxa schiedti]|nr:phosphomevalonate kinase [Pelomyxa schiedti]
MHKIFETRYDEARSKFLCEKQNIPSSQQDAMPPRLSLDSSVGDATTSKPTGHSDAAASSTATVTNTEEGENNEKQIRDCWEDMVKQVLLDSFSAVEANFLVRAEKMNNNSGAAALIVLSQQHMGVMTLYIAHLGDCRAVLCRSEVAEPLTEDHTPKRADEAERIQAAGGRLVEVFDELRRVRSRRVSRPTLCRKTMPVTRVIGVREYKTPIKYLSATPEVICVHLQEHDSLMVVASNGIWNLLGNQEVIDIAKKYTDPYEAATNVAQAAKRKAPATGQIADDLAVIVLRFETSTTSNPSTSNTTSTTTHSQNSNNT